MNIIINIDLKDDIFKDYNYHYPQPLINLLGKSILEWVLDYNNISLFNNIIIIHNNDDYEYLLRKIIKNNYDNYQFKIYSLKKLSIINILSNILTMYNNNFLFIDTNNIFSIKNIELTTNKIFYYSTKNGIKKGKYLLDENNNRIIINENFNITNIKSNEVVGFYFNNVNLLIDYINKLLIINNMVFINNLSIINLVNMMIFDNIFFDNVKLNNDNIYNLDSPLNLRLFCNNYPKIDAINNNLMVKPKKIVFQLEGVLLDNIDGIYLGNTNYISYLLYLKRFGNIIIINTIYDKFILDTVIKLGIEYDIINFNCDNGDFYINSKNVLLDNLDKSLGFYNDKIDARDFNELVFNLDKYTKTSGDLSGQIYYYLNIPKEVKDIFPLLLDYDSNNKWYTMESINGVNISNLYTSEVLTLEQFDNILGTLNRIHNCVLKDVVNDVNIYGNYVSKMCVRYNSYDYSIFHNSDILYNFLKENLEKYESKKLGKLGVIHGDSVFTNILINKFGKIKMIDMRGSIDGICSIHGDIFYDYAKIYQSLIGYDEILKDVKVSNSYRDKFINHFKNRFVDYYGNDVFYYLLVIVASLLFTLIPLHNNDKCIKYYNLIDELGLFSFN